MIGQPTIITCFYTSPLRLLVDFSVSFVLGHVAIGVDGFPTVEPNCFHLRKITETLGCHNMQHYQLSVTEADYYDENKEFCEALVSILICLFM